MIQAVITWGVIIDSRNVSNRSFCQFLLNREEWLSSRVGTLTPDVFEIFDTVGPSWVLGRKDMTTMTDMDKISDLRPKKQVPIHTLHTFGEVLSRLEIGNKTGRWLLFATEGETEQP